MSNTYDVGDQVTLGNPTTAVNSRMPTTVEPFKNSAGTATDPSQVKLKVLSPSGTTTTYTWPTPGAGESQLTRETTGRFYANISITAAGVWTYQLKGTGTIEAMEEGVLSVRTPAIT